MQNSVSQIAIKKGYFKYERTKGIIFIIIFHKSVYLRHKHICTSKRYIHFLFMKKINNKSKNFKKFREWSPKNSLKITVNANVVQHYRNITSSVPRTNMINDQKIHIQMTV